MSKNKTGLGRGLESLIPTNFVVDEVAAPGESVKNINISEIIVNPDQPRKHFDASALSELSASIKQHGIIQPLVVTPRAGKYRIVAGERRFRAAKMAKQKKIPVIVRNHEELEELEISLVENVQRVDLSPLEQAVSVVRLRDQFSLSLKEIASKLGKAETTISNIIRLLQLPKEAIKALQNNQISEGHGRAILALKTDRKLQIELLNKIVVQKLSVRDAENFVKQHRQTASGTKNKTASPATLERLVGIKNTTGLQPKIITRKKGGYVQIPFSNDNDLENILRNLEK